MAVFSTNEYDSAPANPEQWDQYYNRLDDNLYIQTLRATTAAVGTIVGAPTGAVRASNEVTITTAIAHGLIVGDQVTIAGVTDTTFNEAGVEILSVPSATTFTFSQVAANATSGDGTVTPDYPNWQSISTGREVRDSVRVTDTLTRAKYIGRDYQTFLDEGLAWLREQYGDKFTNFAANDPAIMFVKYVASALDTLSWYMDKEVTEWFWPLLRLRSRAELLAKYLAYKPRPATACTADLNVTLTGGPYAFDVPVPIGFQWSGPSDLIFEFTQEVLFTAGETEKTLQPTTQGETIEETFTSDGEAVQQFELQALPDGTYIAEGSSRVFVANVEWDVEDFLPFGRENAVEILYGLDPPVVNFGDGVVGNIPEAGSEILVRYIATKATAGLAATAGTITDPVGSLVVNFQDIPIEATNPAGASGGGAIETLDEIKATAPSYFKTADRGVTKQDLTTLANIFSDGVYGSVSKAKANIVRGIETDYALQAKLAAIQTDADLLTGYLNQISSEVDDIGTARVAVAASVTTIGTEATSGKANLTDAENNLETAKTALEKMPFQQVVGEGTGGITEFSTTLRPSVYPKSVVVWVDGLTQADTGADGDCDADAGFFSAVSATFDESYVGAGIEISGQMRQITRFITATKVGYSGVPLEGTGLTWYLYEPGVFGIDDGVGVISGTGIDSGSSSVNYTSGAIEVKLNIAPAGTSSFGSNVMVQYAYEDTTVGGWIDDAVTDIGEADTDFDDIDTAKDDITTQLAAIETAETNIDVQITLSLLIPTSIESNLEDLEEYLDEQLSGECKANIVIVQALVVDEDGYYAAPSQALLTALKVQLDEHNVVPTTISTVSGYRNIVAVDMTYGINVSDPYKYTEVLSRVQPVVNDMFRGRDYGEDLHRSYYYGLVAPNPTTGQGGVAGVSFANISITGTSFPDPAATGTPPSVDSDGNLVINQDYILTIGTITYSEITS